MTDTQIVNQEEPVIEVPNTGEEVTDPAPLPGEKTDSALLLESLKEEREKRRQAEARVKELETPEPDPEIFSDEGQSLKRELDSIKEKLALTEAHGKFPQLKDKAAEFEDYRNDPENKGMSVAAAAKAFLAEKGLLTPPTTPRKGLENDTGGGRQPQNVGRTEEEIAELRKNNFRQYSKELRAGTLRK